MRGCFLYPVPPATLQSPSDPQGTIPHSFTYPLSQVPVTPLSGGSVKVVDSTTFTASTTMAVAEVVVEPGAMRCEFMPVHVRLSDDSRLQRIARTYFLRGCSTSAHMIHQWHPTQDEWDFYL